MPTSLSVRNGLIAVLSAAVVGLAAVVVVDHTSGPAAPAPAALTAVNAASGFTGDAAAAGHPDMKAVLDRFAQELGVTPAELRTDVMNGQTLDDIATAHQATTGKSAAQVRADVLTYVTMGLDRARQAGAISAAQEASLVNDATDAVSQLFAAQIGKLITNH